MEMDAWYFLAVLPVVAFLYAAVGHGGASGYLALMALFSFTPEVMKPTALLLNLFVAGISFFHYWKEGFFNKKLFLSFAIGSIPLSFVGGMLTVDTKTYKLILGVLLLFAVLKMLNVFSTKKQEIRIVRTYQGILTGGAIGFFSGLIGIGGGIILSTVLLLLRWGNVKEKAAVSAWCIWVNSASGMMGKVTSGITLAPLAWVYVGIAIIGGYLGGFVGSKKMDNKSLRMLLAFVLLLASVKLFLF